MQTSRLQYSVGRLIEPSSIGGQVSLDQIRVQYNRGLTRRLSGSVSARITRQEALANGPGHRDRSYGDAFLRYALTPKWDLTGGYRFAWQRLPVVVNSTLVYDPAQSHGVYVTIGYHGLNPYGH
jgi:outer membrane receptor protein involved in Fe transport